MLWALCSPAPAQTLNIIGALTAPGSGPTFPEQALLTKVNLPDDWARSRPGFEGVLWYRVPFKPTASLGSDDLLALYIEHVCSNFQVLLNG